MELKHAGDELRRNVLLNYQLGGARRPYTRVKGELQTI